VSSRISSASQRKSARSPLNLDAPRVSSVEAHSLISTRIASPPGGCALANDHRAARLPHSDRRLQVDKLLRRGRDAAAQAAIKFSAAFRASRKLFLAGQPHFGECPLFSLPRCAPDHAASRAPRLRPPTLRRLNRTRAAGLSSLDPSGGNFI
jgi:hypothetical protein